MDFCRNLHYIQLEHPVPTPLATIPKGWLWTTLATPPLVTLLGNVIASFSKDSSAYGESFLLVPLVVFFVILGNFPFFKSAVGKRYQGRSLVFLNLAYFFGQIIVCLSLWVGSCLLFVN